MPKEFITVKKPLTDSMVIGISSELSTALSDKYRLEESVKNFTQQARKRLKVIDERIHGLNESLVSGEYEGMIECEVEFDFVKGIKIYRDVDTGEEHQVTAITKEEYQLSLEANEPVDGSPDEEVTDASETPEENNDE